MQEEKYYTCRNDKAFKYLFLDETNKHILKELLESILQEKITNITLLPTERIENTLKTRNKTVDALVEINDEIIEIEINSTDYIGLRPRNMAYISNIYSSYTEKGNEYTEDELILQINLTYEMMYKKNKEEIDNKKIREYYMQDEDGKRYVKNLKIIEINMDYFVNLWYTKNKSEIEKYKYLIMLDLKEEDLKKLSKEDRVVEEYMDKLNGLNKDPIFKKLMTDEEDRKKYENTIRRNAKEEGINERNIEIAKKLLSKGIYSKEEISDITGLSVEEISKIKEEINREND